MTQPTTSRTILTRALLEALAADAKEPPPTREQAAAKLRVKIQGLRARLDAEEKTPTRRLAPAGLQGWR